MKLFERVIEQRLRSHLEQIGFVNKHQSGFRRAKSTDDHLFRLSQSIMKSFNRGEHVVAAFLDVEKAFDNVWHNGLRYNIFQLDFLVGPVIQVNVIFATEQMWCGVPNGASINLNLEKTKVIIFSRSIIARKTELNLNCMARH